MGKINLLITNAAKSFTNEETTMFQNAAKAAETYLTENFEFDYAVDIVITPPSYLMQTIPEDGITGRTYTSRFIIIVINKDEAKINEDIVFETICHEMSHSLRWEKVPEYANTLFQGMILEGLAIALEEKAMADTKKASKQFFLKTMQETDDKMIKNIISVLEKDFDNERYDYDTVFYTGNDSLPRWAGYRLGYHFVMKHLEDTGQTIQAATLASYNKFKS